MRTMDVAELDRKLDRLLQAAHATLTLETILGILARIESHEAVVPHVGRFDQTDTDVLQVIGFTIADEPQYHSTFRSTVKWPWDGDRNRLPVARRIVRAKLQALQNPPASAVHRLAARMDALPHAQLVALLASAASRDTATVDELEVALRQRPAPPWAMLPDRAIALVATTLQGSLGLRWCGVCQSFRAAQPRVHTLTLGTRWHDGEVSENTAEAALCVRLSDTVLRRLSDTVSTKAHRLLETVSPRHAAEVHTLMIAAVHAEPDEPLRVEPARPHGLHFTALRRLHLHHPAAGFTGAAQHTDPNNTLAFCAKQLIMSVGRTLQALELSCVTRFEPADLLAVLPHLNNLTELRANLIPWNAFCNTFADRGAGRAEDTLRVQEAARAHCPRLSTMDVACHRLPREAQ